MNENTGTELSTEDCFFSLPRIDFFPLIPSVGNSGVLLFLLRGLRLLREE